MRVCIFDFDGTLVDSDFIQDDAIVSVCERFHLDRSLELLQPYLYRQRPRSQPIWKHLVLPARSDRVALLKAIGEEIRERSAACECFPGIPGLLRDLTASGTSIAVATGTTRERFESVAKRTGIRPLINASLCDGEAAKKPSPEMLQKLMRGSEARIACFVGNAEIDAEAARRASIPFVWAQYCLRERWHATPLLCAFRATSVDSLSTYLLS